MEEKFWLIEPGILLSKMTIVPNREMGNNEALNTLTRIIILITIILLLIGYRDWWIFFIFGIILVLILWYSWSNKGNTVRVENFSCRKQKRSKSKSKIKNKYKHRTRRSKKSVNYKIGSRYKYN